MSWPPYPGLPFWLASLSHFLAVRQIVYLLLICLPAASSSMVLLFLDFFFFGGGGDFYFAGLWQMAGCGKKWKKTDKLFVGSVYQNKKSVKAILKSIINGRPFSVFGKTTKLKRSEIVINFDLTLIKKTSHFGLISFSDWNSMYWHFFLFAIIALSMPFSTPATANKVWFVLVHNGSQPPSVTILNWVFSNSFLTNFSCVGHPSLQAWQQHLKLYREWTSSRSSLELLKAVPLYTSVISSPCIQPFILWQQKTSSCHFVP